MPVCAEHEARIAAAVEEEDRLLIAVQRLRQRLEQLVGEERGGPAHVDDLDLRQLSLRPDLRCTGGLCHDAQPRGQLEQLEITLGACVPALGVRGRAAEDGDRAGDRGDLHRDGSGVIARRRVLLLVGPLVRLINHDQAEVGLRGEDRRPRPDDHVVGTALDRVPLVERLAE